MGRLIDADVLIEYLGKYHYPDVFVQGSEDGIGWPTRRIVTSV